MTRLDKHAQWLNRPASERCMGFAEWLQDAPGRAGKSPVTESPVQSPSGSKYRAQRTGKYASKREAKRAKELAVMQQAGIISELREQVWFELTPKIGKVRESSYIADFVYVQDGKQVVEDSKGFRPPVYNLKRKMMLHFHGITIMET